MSIKCRLYSNLATHMKQLNERKEFHAALTLFDNCQEKHLSDQVITQALKACSNLRDLQRGIAIHKLVSTRSDFSPYTLTSLIKLYMNCGEVQRAQEIFDGSKIKSVGMYAAMMKGFIQYNMAQKAVNLFREISNPDEVIVTLLFNACAQVATMKALDFGKQVMHQMPVHYQKDSYVLTSAFDMFIKCGDLSNAESLFLKMKKSIVSCGNLMNLYNFERKPSKTLALYEQMKTEGIKADLITYLLVIKACSQIGFLSNCRSIVADIPPKFLAHAFVQTALVDMWGKAGSVDQAQCVFETITHPDVVTFTAMINCYALNGMGLQAIHLYRRLPKEQMNEWTHVCVLNACSHSGLTDEARSIFSKISMKTGQIYTAMIDCLSRSLCFDEAQQLIEQFEEHHAPDLVMYTAFLSGARNGRNSRLSQEVFDRMQKLFPRCKEDLTSAAILLANTYALSGEVNMASNIRRRLSQSGAKKQVGLSWTSVNGQLLEFRAHDRSHPQSSEIYAELERISTELLNHGHKFDSSWITRPLSEDETVASILCGHSERLAIAFNLIQRPIPSPIQITKNLRVCGDCHQATKLIARIRQCEIIVRDANRFHHFYPNGQCSCQDYF